MTTGDDGETGIMAALEELLSRPDLPEGAVSPLQLARWCAGDLAKAEASRVAAAVREDPVLAARVEEIRTQEASFEAEMPWAAVVESVRQRASALPGGTPAPNWSRAMKMGVPSARRWWRAVWSGAAGAVALVALGMFWTQQELPSDRAGDPPVSRYKADGLLQGFLWVEGRAQPLKSGDRVRTGDRIQFRLSTTHGYLALLGVDGTGTVSRYLPVGGEQSVAFTPGNSQPLTDSFEFDASPGPEVFVAFLSDEALLVEELEQAIHDAVTSSSAGGRAVVSPDWAGRKLAPQVSTFLVEKD